MNFEELLEELHNSEPQPHPTYWKVIADNAHTIILELVMQDSKHVAESLKMSPSKFSSVLPLLKALARNA